jgi:hypothetical protein
MCQGKAKVFASAIRCRLERELSGNDTIVAASRLKVCERTGAVSPLQPVADWTASGGL